jgi:hypothetical protein
MPQARFSEKAELMNIPKFLAPLAILVIAGCQSTHPRASNTIHGTLPNSQVTYTVEMIPNPRLSATSREGDTPGAVYSSNIVAVYVHNPTNNSAGATNGKIIETQSIKNNRNH